MKTDSKIAHKRVKAGDPFYLTDGDHVWDKCRVVAVFPETYTVDVVTEGGQFISSVPIPTAGTSSLSAGGTIYLPKVGTEFGLHYAAGEPKLEFIPNKPTRNQALKSPQRLSTGSSDVDRFADQTNKQRPDYRGNKPRDMLPGDWAQLGDKGNHLAVLDSGVTSLKATDLSQIIASPVGDLLRLLGRNMEFFSDFGEIKLTNDAGKVNMSLRGGAHQKHETSPAANDNFTIEADLGAEGDLIDVKVCNPRGEIQYRHHIYPDGRAETYTRESEKHTIEQNCVMDIGGRSSTNIQGTKEERVGKGANQHVAGNKDTTVNGNNTRLVGGNQFEAVLGDKHVDIGRHLETTVSGEATSAPGDVAHKTVVTNGSYLLDVGNPAAGDNLLARSGVAVRTHTGDISLSSTAGKVILKSAIPDSIRLGGDAPVTHAVLYETLVKFLDVFGNMIDTHVHGGPGTPPVPLPYKMAKPLLKFAKSRFVKMM